MLRRRSVPSHLEPILAAFADTAGAVERSKRALLAAIPAARAPALPLADALFRFREALEQAEAAMPGWRTQETEAEWAACAGAIGRAREREAAVRMAGGELPHDRLLFTLQDLITPLAPFEDAARRIAALRRSR
jgi:hypothetical protein